MFTYLAIMADRTCCRCGKVFSVPSRLRRHNERKTPCAQIIQLEDLSPEERAKKYSCKFCNHRFSSSSGLSTHLRNSCKIANSKDGLDKLAEYTEKRQHVEQAQQMAAMQAQIAELTALVKANHVAPQFVNAPAANSNTHNINTNIGVQNNITLKFFGQETTSHISPASIKALLHKLSSDLPAICGQRLLEGQTHDPGVQRKIETIAKEVLRVLLTDIYANSDHPENLTTYIPNKKENQVMVWGNHEDADGTSAPAWQLQPLELIVPKVQTKILDLVNQHQPWEAPTREKFREYGILIRGAYDCDREALGRLIKSVVIGNKTLLASISHPIQQTPQLGIKNGKCSRQSLPLAAGSDFY